jgi:hypothetical protein
MNRNTLYILIGGGVVLVLVVIAILLNLNSSSNIAILVNKTNIVNYGVIDDTTVVYQTTDNGVYKSTNNQVKLLFQANPKDIINISPLRKYYSNQHNNDITIYSLPQNLPVNHFSASLFRWQKDDSYIYTTPIQKTTDPALAVDDVVLITNIFYAENPNKSSELLDKKPINDIVYYSANPKVLYYLTPSTTGNSLQESVLVKDTFSNTTNLSTYSNPLIKTFNDGVVLTDPNAGNSIFSDGVQYTNKDFTIQSGLQKINNQLSSLKLSSRNDRWYLDITSIQDGKTKSMLLPLPKNYNGQNLRNPFIQDSMVFFQSDSGIYSTDLGSNYAQ